MSPSGGAEGKNFCDVCVTDRQLVGPERKSHLIFDEGQSEWMGQEARVSRAGKCQDLPTMGGRGSLLQGGQQGFPCLPSRMTLP